MQLMRKMAVIVTLLFPQGIVTRDSLFGGIHNFVINVLQDFKIDLASADIAGFPYRRN